MFGVMAFVFPHDTCDGWSPAVLGMVQHLPVHGKWGKNSLLSLLVWLLLSLLHCLVSAHGFSHFYLCDFLPHPTWVREQQLCGG